MNSQILPSMPLITHDPYFSVWSPGATLTEQECECWTGAKKIVTGLAVIDGSAYRFLGLGSQPELKQTSARFEATCTSYTFSGAGIELDVRFTSPLLLSDMELLSRPCSYLDFAVRSSDGKEHNVSISVSFDEGHCYDGEERQELAGGVHTLGDFRAAWMGKRKQSPLNHSGDDITIDWGYLYLAVPANQAGTVQFKKEDRDSLEAVLDLGDVQETTRAFLVAAYDDMLSIQYFGQAKKAYWARNNKTILEAIAESIAEHDLLITRCDLFDSNLRQSTAAAGGEPYADICAAAYRQSIAAHKLIEDDGKLIFLSKECGSNGCIGTTDISYPSTPLFLMYAPELVKGMLRPIFKFSRLPVWNYAFAPHDVGRYPYATGQVYGANHRGFPEGAVHPLYYGYPAGSDVYDDNLQMPVEECGNMLIMAAAVSLAEGNFDFAEENFDLLQKWACYLIDFGQDPGNQLCTDDFAGHLAHNVNLSAKAVMGIAAFSLILDGIGRSSEAVQYMEKARGMAVHWEKTANRGDHTAITFDRDEGWSLKYNLVWDLLFETNLFEQETFTREIAWYIKMQNKYGVPLDSRKEYTKSDWILWVSAMADNMDDRKALIAPIATFLTEAPDHVPFSDWYETVSGKFCHFKHRAVQGGLFMPLLMDLWSEAE